MIFSYIHRLFVLCHSFSFNSSSQLPLTLNPIFPRFVSFILFQTQHLPNFPNSLIPPTLFSLPFFLSFVSFRTHRTHLLISLSSASPHYHNLVLIIFLPFHHTIAAPHPLHHRLYFFICVSKNEEISP